MSKTKRKINSVDEALDKLRDLGCRVDSLANFPVVTKIDTGRHVIICRDDELIDIANLEIIDLRNLNNDE